MSWPKDAQEKNMLYIYDSWKMRLNILKWKFGFHKFNMSMCENFVGGQIKTMVYVVE